ncbi:hypothetical protein F4777DRAFT_593675 [Nemania sp. FL0916]|nr:hypothetical protein F4777DRAFT_593675 [Nemania sp. FL0916]
MTWAVPLDDVSAQVRHIGLFPSPQLLTNRALPARTCNADNQKDNNGLAPAKGVTTGHQEKAKQMSRDIAARVSCYVTDCDAKCKRGTNSVTQMNGQPGKLSSASRCDANKYRTLCCEDGTTMGTCRWRGYRGLGLSCMGGCDDGETEVVQDTSNHSKNGDQTCTGGIQSYCCKGFHPAPKKAQPEEQAKEKAADVAEAAAKQAALDIAANAFCRVAIPALLAPLELIEAAIPIFGEIADLIELAATPALIHLCAEGIEKEGKAEFKVFGKKHSVAFTKPSKTVLRPPRSSHPPVKTSSCPASANPARNLTGSANPRARAGCKRKRTVTVSKVTTEIALTSTVMKDPINCAGDSDYPEACRHYRSVINVYPQYKTITCGYRNDDKKLRPILDKFNSQRQRPEWAPYITNAPNGCSPNEYPPAVMAPFNDGWDLLTSLADKYPAIAHKMSSKPPAVEGQMVRYLDATQNARAGNLFNNKCQEPPDWNVGHTSTITVTDSGIETEYVVSKMTVTRRAYTMAFPGLDAGDGIDGNECVPTFNGAKHPGYALLNEDKWFDFDAHAREKALQPVYAKGPSAIPLAQKRWVDDDDAGVGLVVIDANSTRLATPEELRRHLGFATCGDDKCTRELEALRAVVGMVRDEAERTQRLAAKPALVSAVPTPEIGDDGKRGRDTMLSLPGSGSEYVAPKQTVGLQGSS